MNTKWTPVTATDPKPDDSLIDLIFTPQEYDLVMLTKLDVMALKIANRQFTEGLVVTHLQPSDLTEQERESFLRWGGVL